MRENLHGCSVIDFDEDVSKLITAFKENGQRVLAKFIAAAIANSTETPQPGVILIAVPSARLSFAKRGFSPAQEIAIELAKKFNLAKPRIALKLIHSAKDQASLNVDDRKLNLVEAMRASASIANRRVILVDDIVTTGSTLIEGARAVTAAGGTVVGFLTFAETKRIFSNIPSEISEIGLTFRHRQLQSRSA